MSVVGEGKGEVCREASGGAEPDRSEHFYVRLLSALYFATFCIRASFGMFIVAFPIYIGVGSFHLGLLWAASPLFEFLSVLWIGAIIDRHGRKVVLVAGLLLGMVSLVALILTRNPYAVFLINGLHGVSSGCIIVSSLALMADYVRPETRGRAIGVFDGVNIFGWATGFFLGGVFMQVFSSDIELVFVVAGGFAFLGALYGWFNISEPDTESNLVKEMKFSHLAGVLRQRSLLYLVLTWFSVYVLIGSMLAHSTNVGGAMRLSSLETGAMMGGVCVAILATQRFFGSLSDRLGRSPVMVVGVAGITGAMIVVGVGILSADAFTFDALKPVLMPWWPLLGFFFLLAMAFPPAALAALADDAQEKRKGLTMGVFALAMSGGMVVGPPSIGWVSEHLGSKGVFIYVLAVLASITLFVALRVRAQRHGR